MLEKKENILSSHDSELNIYPIIIKAYSEIVEAIHSVKPLSEVNIMVGTFAFQYQDLIKLSFNPQKYKEGEKEELELYMTIFTYLKSVRKLLIEKRSHSLPDITPLIIHCTPRKMKELNANSEIDYIAKLKDKYNKAIKAKESERNQLFNEIKSFFILIEEQSQEVNHIELLLHTIKIAINLNPDLKKIGSRPNTHSDIKHPIELKEKFKSSTLNQLASPLRSGNAAVAGWINKTQIAPWAICGAATLFFAYGAYKNKWEGAVFVTRYSVIELISQLISSLHQLILFISKGEANLPNLIALKDTIIYYLFSAKEWRHGMKYQCFTGNNENIGVLFNLSSSTTTNRFLAYFLTELAKSTCYYLLLSVAISITAKSIKKLEQNTGEKQGLEVQNINEIQDPEINAILKTVIEYMHDTLTKYNNQLGYEFIPAVIYGLLMTRLNDGLWSKVAYSVIRGAFIEPTAKNESVLTSCANIFTAAASGSFAYLATSTISNYVMEDSTLKCLSIVFEFIISFSVFSHTRWTCDWVMSKVCPSTRALHS